MSNWAHQQGPPQRQKDEHDKQDELDPQQLQQQQFQQQQQQHHQQQYPNQFSFQHRYYPYAQYRHYPHKYHNALPMIYHQNSSFPAASPPDAVPQYLYLQPGAATAPAPAPGPGPGPGYSFYPGYQPPPAGASRQPSVATLQIPQPLAPPRMKVKPEQQPPLPPPAASAAIAASPSIAPEDDDEARGAQGYVHKCHLCNKSFKRRSWLRRHLLSHSPARHFSCPWCLSKHKRKDNLLQHMKLKHTDYVLQELRLHHVHVASDAPTTNNIRTLLYEGRLNKDEVKKVLNSLIDRHNQ